VFSYQVTEDAARAMLRSVRGRLVPEGVFIFDYWNRGAVELDPPKVRLKRAEDDAHQVVRISQPEWSPEQGIGEIAFEVFIRSKPGLSWQLFKETHSMKAFRLKEVEAFLEEEGFTLIGQMEWFSGLPASDSIFSPLVLARRRPDSAT
jgi:hypothetical protein